MANVYTVTASDGTTYDVTTEKHHTQLDEASFKKHLTDVIKNTISNTGALIVVRWIFKERI